MIKEALAYIAGLATEAVKPVEILSEDPRAKRYMVGGKMMQVDAPIEPRNIDAHSLDDLTAMISGLHEDGDVPVVYVNEGCAMAVMDHRGHRVEFVTFSLKPSDVWLSVKAMKEWKTQKDFIRLLKIELAGCLPENALLDIVRKVKFENGVTVAQEVKKNRESLGKEITSKVETAVEIPDYVRLSVPVYKSLGERETYDLTCSVEIDPTRVDAFRLAPIPDAIETVQQAAVQSILERLRDSLPEGVLCYYGSP